MKVTSGELILTIVTILGIGIVGGALYKFAPDVTNQIQSYVTSFFSSGAKSGFISLLGK